MYKELSVDFVENKKDECDCDRYWFYANVPGWDPTLLKFSLNDQGELVTGSIFFFEVYEEELDWNERVHLLNLARLRLPTS